MKNVVRAIAGVVLCAVLVPFAAGAQDRSIPPDADFDVYTWNYAAVSLPDHPPGQIWELVPIQKTGLPRNLVQVATGGTEQGLIPATTTGGSFAALTDEGIVWTWGDNLVGQLGDGTGTSRDQPQPIDGFKGFTRIAARRAHMLAVRIDGTVWGWGENEFHQLGDGTTINRLSPVQVTGLTGIVQIATGILHSLAVQKDGTVWAWGVNKSSQLGDGTTINRPTPIRVPGLTGIVSVAAGDEFSLALGKDGSIWAWGNNDNYQLGLGNTIPQSRPVRIPDTPPVARLAAGSNSGYAIRPLTTPGKRGAPMGWGSNELHKILNGNVDVVIRPQFIPSNGESMEVAASRNNASIISDFRQQTYGQILGDGTLLPSPLLMNTDRSGWLKETVMDINGVVALSVHSTIIPDVRGLNQQDALIKAAKSFRSIVGGFNDVVADNCSSLGRVLDQTPTRGIRVVVPSSLPDMTVSFATECRIRIPDLTGVRVEDLSDILPPLHLRLGTLSSAVDQSCNNIGTVMSQSPPGNTAFLVDAVPVAVNVVIGERPTQTECP